MEHLIKDENLELSLLAQQKVRQRTIRNLGEVYLTQGFNEIK